MFVQVHRRALIVLMLIFCLEPLAHSQMLTLGPPEVVPNAVFGQLPNIVPDGHIAYLPTGNKFQMYWAEYSSYRTVGDSIMNMSPSSTPVLTAGPKGSFDNGGAWLYSVFRQNGNNLIGFYHAEDHEFAGNPSTDLAAWFQVALCTSTDDGVTWQKRGLIITSSAQKPIQPTQGGDGAQSVVWDPSSKRWFCFYLAVGSGISMAVSSDPGGAPGTWLKYYNGSFSEPGLGGRETPISTLLSVLGGQPGVHYNSFLQKWVMLYHSWLGQAPMAKSIWLSTSLDLVNWSSPVRVLAPSYNEIVWFPSVIGDSSSAQVGQQGYLYYASFVGENLDLPRKLMRRSIQFLKPTTIATTPLAPTLTFPADGAMNLSPVPELSWNITTGAVSFRLQVSTDTTFLNPILDDSTVVTTSRRTGLLTLNKTYYWRMMAKNEKGYSTWSPVRSFTTIASVPQPPALSAPADSASNVSVNPALAWGASAGASSYWVQVATNPSFPSPFINDSTITTTSRQIGPLSNNKKYYWRTSAKNDLGSGPWSPIRSFTTAVSVPAPPTLAAPSDTAKNVPLNTSLSWNAVTGATSYHLQLSSNATFTSTLDNDSTLTTTSKAVGPLSLATTYFWRVRAKNDGGYGDFSTARQFSTIRTTLVEKIGDGIPTDFELTQNYPNPFNPSTIISYALPKAANVSLRVFNALGQEVAVLVNEQRSAGYYQVQWNANVPSGIYFYRLQAGEFNEAKKMILLR